MTYANNYGNILHIATQYGNVKILTKLLKTDIYNVNHLDKHDRTPIFYSVMKDDFESVKALYQKLAFLDFQDKEGMSIIDYARKN